MKGTDFNYIHELICFAKNDTIQDLAFWAEKLYTDGQIGKAAKVIKVANRLQTIKSKRKD